MGAMGEKKTACCSIRLLCVCVVTRVLEEAKQIMISNRFQFFEEKKKIRKTSTS